MENVTVTINPRNVNGIAQYVVGGSTGRLTSATISIFENDIAPNIWIGSVRNGEEGGQHGYFRLFRDNTQNAVTVHYTISGTASNGTDYTGLNGQITFVEGQDYVDVPVTVTDDMLVEHAESVVLTRMALPFI